LQMKTEKFSHLIFFNTHLIFKQNHLHIFSTKEKVENVQNFSFIIFSSHLMCYV
jgi:hypothetical protein